MIVAGGGPNIVVRRLSRAAWNPPRLPSNQGVSNPMNRKNDTRPGGLFSVGLTETNRLEAFSDGVFAVAITLLVLDVRLPTPLPQVNALWAALFRLTPAFASWVISFGFVLVIWVNHHYLFNQLRHTDRGLMWLNGLLLFGISFIPFPTSLAGAYFLATPGLFLLSLAMFIVSGAFWLMRWYAAFGAQLMHEEVSRAARSLGVRRSAAAPVLYAMAMALAFLWPPGAMLIQFLVPVLFFLRSPSHARPKAD